MQVHCSNCGAEQTVDTTASAEITCIRCGEPIEESEPPTEKSMRRFGASAEQLLDEFDAAWDEGRRLDIDAVYKAQCANGSSLLFELAAIDLEYRIKQGEATGAHDYFRRYPNLRANRSRAVALIETEYRFRNRHSDELTVAECLDRYPEFRSELTMRLTESPPTSPFKSFNPGRRLGRFELLECIGHGSFGAVYRARDDELNRTVAIKIPRGWSFATADDEDRFVREAKNAGRLKHSGIVAVHEVGREDGMPFIVTEFVDGETLSDAFAGDKLTIRQSAELLADIADALAYAHREGVVHRDLKPANVMLERIDGGYRPRILDFGLARDTSFEATMTQEGQILGTPAYMSPEQARGESHTVDGRSDVYSLGAILYLLLAGVPPFRGSARQVVRQAIHDEPVGPRQLNTDVPRDLETICLKCLEKEPARRFSTADEAGEELRRYLRGEPIRSRPISSLGRFRRWCGRNRVVAGLGFGLLFALVTGLISVATLWLRAESLADEEQRQRLAANESTRKADAHRREAQKNATIARTEQRRTKHYLYVAHMNLVQQAWQAANTDRMRELLRKYIPKAAGEDDLRTFAWHHWWCRCHRERRTVNLKLNSVRTMSVSPNGRHALVVGNETTARVFDLKHGRLIHELAHLKPAWSGCWSPDGRRVVTSTYDGLCSIWNAETGKLEHEFRAHRRGGMVVAFRHDGESFATTGYSDRTIKIWHTRTRRLAATLTRRDGEPIRSLAFMPSGRYLVAAGLRLEFWDLQASKLIADPRPHGYYVGRVAVSPDGARLATTGHDKRIVLWDPKTLKPVKTLARLATRTSSLCFSPDGSFLLSTGIDRTARLWNVVSGELAAVFKGHSTPINSGRFVDEGRRIVTLDNRATMKFWDVHEERRTRIRVRSNLFHCAISPNGRTIATGGFGSLVLIRDAVTGEVVRKLSIEGKRVTAVRWSADGSSLAAATTNGLIRLWNTRTWKSIDVQSPLRNRGVYGLSLARGSIISTDADGTFLIHDARSGLLQSKRERLGESLSVSDDARFAAVNGSHGLVIVDLDRNTVRPFPAAGSSRRGELAFSIDGRLLAVAQGRDVEIWDVRQRHLVKTLRGHSRAVTCLRFSPDGTTLVSAGHDHCIKLWDLRTWESHCTLTGNGGPVYSLGFTPDGKTMITGGNTPYINFWRTAGYGSPPDRSSSKPAAGIK